MNTQLSRETVFFVELGIYPLKVKFIGYLHFLVRYL